MNEPPVAGGDPTLGFRSDLDSSFAAAEQRMRSRVAAEIGATSTSVTPRPDRSRPDAPDGAGLPTYVAPPAGRSRRRVLVLGAAAMVVVLLGVGLVLRQASRPGVEVPSVDAIAAAAMTTPAVPFAAGSPVEFDVLTIEQRGSATVSRLTRTTAYSDGSGVLVAEAEQLVDGEAGTDLAGPSTTETSLGSVVDDLAYVELLGLPTDPAVLVVSLESQLDTEDPARVAEVLAWVASAEAATPAERAASIVALGQLATTGPALAEDPLGREGVELGGEGWSVILDPANGSVLAFHSTAGASGTDPAADAWTIWSP